MSIYVYDKTDAEYKMMIKHIIRECKGKRAIKLYLEAVVFVDCDGETLRAVRYARTPSGKKGDFIGRVAIRLDGTAQVIKKNVDEDIDVEPMYVGEIYRQAIFIRGLLINEE